MRHHLSVSLDDWILVVDAADELGVSPRQVLTLISRGTLRAMALNRRMFIVERQSVEQYKKTRRPPGRPRSVGPGEQVG